MTLISPVSKIKTAFNAIKPKSVNHNSSPINDYENDVVEINKKNNGAKYALCIAAGAIALSATTLGVVALTHYMDIKQVQKSAKKIQQNAGSIINEALSKLQNVEANQNGDKVIEEFKKGTSKAAKKMILSENGILTVDDFVSKTRIEADSADTFNFYKNFDFKKAKNGIIKAKEVFCFENGNLSAWQNKYLEKPSGAWSMAKELHFLNGKISQYQKGIKEDSMGNFTIKTDMIFNNGKLSKIGKNYLEAEGYGGYEKLIEFPN